MTDIFYSFGEAAKYYKQCSWDMANMVRTSLESIGKYVQQVIRSKHGVQQPGRPSSESNTPLYKTGSLQKAVAYRVNFSTSEVEIYSNKERLAIIHEYGCTFRMTDKQRKYLFATVFKDSPAKGSGSGQPGYITIPARPIRRVAMEDSAVQNSIENIIEKGLDKVFR